MATLAAPVNVLALAITDDDLRSVPKPVEVNCVCTCRLSDRRLSTYELAYRLPGVDYNPQLFAAAKLRLPRSVVLAFCKGEGVCPGARSEWSSRLSALYFTDVHSRAGELVRFRAFRTRNLVMVVWVPFEVYLNKLVAAWKGHVDYNESNFPGCAFRIGCGPDYGVTIVVFTNGRCVIMQAKRPADAYRAWYWFYTRVLCAFRRDTPAGTTSSAAYRNATSRRNDTLADDCRRIASRHTRRRDGPMAASPVYRDFVAHTPRTSRAHAPATVRREAARSAPAPVSALASLDAAAAAASAAAAESTLEERAEHLRARHGARCPLMCAARAASASEDVRASMLAAWYVGTARPHTPGSRTPPPQVRRLR